MTAPHGQTLSVIDPGFATATDDTITIGEAPFAGTVTSVTFTPDAAITGAASNHRALRLINKGAAGAGTTIIAELAFDNGVNAVAFDEKAITLSATPASLVVAEGDVLALFSEAVGTGLADPGGTVQVTINRTYA
jgi:hypothetical protein